MSKADEDRVLRRLEKIENQTTLSDEDAVELTLLQEEAYWILGRRAEGVKPVQRRRKRKRRRGGGLYN